MINHYSYTISRKEAYSKKLKDQDIFNEDNFQKDFNDFLEVWGNIQKEVTQYKCTRLEEQYLNSQMPLIHFLVDDGEVGKGMYLAGGYEKFIKIQNGFLKPIINALKQNKESILYYFNESLKNKTDVQKATYNEIIIKEFPKYPDKCSYINFLQLIMLNSYRNIYFKNDYSKINYFNYNNFIYDLDIIEEELGKIILTGKKLFNDTIHFVTYTYEGFRGKKFGILNDFINIYPHSKLKEEETKQLFNYLKEKNNNNDIDFIQLIFSIQQIIYYLTQEKMDYNTKFGEL